MKPLIYATPAAHNKIREEEHLHDAILSSLEAVGVDYATSVFDEYDLVHFINPEDIKKIFDAKRAGRKTVVNALFCETEKKTVMIDVKMNNKYVLKGKYHKSLNLADLVLVPGENAKKFLEEQGIVSRIEVFPAPIDFSRFENQSKKIYSLFRSYFGEKKDAIYVMSVGDYASKVDMENLLEIVELCPFAKFYFFGANYNMLAGSKYIKNSPDNIVFSTLVDDDIYRSSILNAKIFLVLNARKIEAMNVIEAMAAKTQVVAVCPKKNSPSYLEDGKNAYVRDGIMELVDCVHKLSNSKLKPTTEAAYKFAKQFDVVKSGEKLKHLYEMLLK